MSDEQRKGNSRVSYGNDAGKEEFKQKGDWRNILVLIAYVKNFELDNITIKNSHAWAISFERTWHAKVSNIRLENPEEIDVGGKNVKVFNKDGINLRHGCKFFQISNIVGINGDDLIALSSLDVKPFFHSNGDVNSYQVTSTKWNGQHDDTEQITITNCQTNYTGVAIRASGNAGIHHVYVNGVITKARPDIPPPYGGSPYTLLVGGRGYGTDSEAGKINNVYAMNLMGDGKNLILIEAPVSTCSFSSGFYSGPAAGAITYKIEKDKTTEVIENDLVQTN